MNFTFDKKIDDFLKIIIKSAQNQKIRVFFVGGIVRDNILKMPVSDIDLLVLGNAIEFTSKLPDIIKIKSIHKDFCTVKVEYENLCIDIASTRTEKYPYSGCLPVVEKIGVDLEKDYTRRDFSINSLYCELDIIEDKITYKLIDLCNGVDDIKNKTLRVLHKRSYIDDPTRILRGVNFKHRFGFEFSSYDKELINKYLDDIDIKNASYDRIFAVFEKILYNFEIFKELVEEKYYSILFKNNVSFDFDSIVKISQEFHLTSLENKDFYIKLFENDKIEKLNFKNLVEMYNIFNKFSKAELAYYYYKTSDSDVLNYYTIKDVSLKINGNDLLSLNYPKGKLYKEIFDNLLNQKFYDKLFSCDKLNTKEDEISWLKSNYPI